MGNFATPVDSAGKGVGIGGKGVTKDKALSKAGIKRGKSLLPFGPSLTYSASKLPGGKEAFIEYVRVLVRMEAHPLRAKFEKFLFAWDQATISEKRYLSLEDLCIAGDIPIAEVFGEVGKVAFQIGVDVSAYIAAVELPNVVAASVRNAKKSSFFDRQMLMQGAGVAPTPKGSTINVNQNNNNNAQAANVERGLPSFEDDSKSISKAVRPEILAPDQKLLPAEGVTHGLSADHMSSLPNKTRAEHAVVRDRQHSD